MNDYIKGTLTGASLVLCFFMFVSAKSQSKNLGDIVVNSIAVVDAEGKGAAYLGIGPRGGGLLGTYNAEGKETADLGISPGGGGQLRTFNKHEVMTGYFGSNKDNDGVVLLSDRYGDPVWTASGKK